jgi:hypothetical protein
MVEGVEGHGVSPAVQQKANVGAETHSNTVMIAQKEAWLFG